MPNSHDISVVLTRIKKKFMARDAMLLESHAHERTVTHRLGLYLQQAFPKLHVDCEYNRQGVGSDPKRDSRRKRRFPDIVVHRRGNNSMNLLVIEAKPAWSSSDRKEMDREKLRRIVGEFGYRHAYLVVYSSGKSAALEFEKIC
jgi:hypothetical protein